MAGTDDWRARGEEGGEEVGAQGGREVSVVFFVAQRQSFADKRTDKCYKFQVMVVTELGSSLVLVVRHGSSVHSAQCTQLGKRTEGTLEVFIFFGFGTPFYPLEDNLLEPNPVGKKCSHKPGLCDRYAAASIAPIRGAKTFFVFKV